MGAEMPTINTTRMQHRQSTISIISSSSIIIIIIIAFSITLHKSVEPTPSSLHLYLHLHAIFFSLSLSIYLSISLSLSLSLSLPIIQGTEECFVRFHVESTCFGFRDGDDESNFAWKVFANRFAVKRVSIAVS